jgi:hypothetical protein
MNKTNNGEREETQDQIQAKIREKRGLILKFIAVEIKLVKWVLSQNGFVDFEDLSFMQKENWHPLIMWSSKMVPQNVYQNMMKH